MTPGGRIQAAIEVLDDIAGNRRPASEALKDWGRTHRFAGAGDRAAIGNLVFDALRHRNSLAARMGDDGARALALAAAAGMLDLTADALDAMCAVPHGPGALSEAERARLSGAPAAEAPWIAGDYPDWLQPAFERVFGDRAAEEGRALARRAPIDLRVNTLKATREKVLRALERFGAQATPLSPLGVRIAPPGGFGRSPNVEREPGHGRGHYEVQDEGSQIVSLLAGAGPGLQVADICAGGGGKTLAMAAQMDNHGQIYAYDANMTRLRPIFERLQRAGVRNAQVLGAHETDRLEGLEGRMDLVLVDAPCSGTGAWRRRPDAKWRLTPRAVERRLAEQQAVLQEASRLVRPGGRIAYVTCSVLPEENGDRVAAFLKADPSFRLVPWTGLWAQAVGGEPPASADGSEETLLLTPADHGTDGFFLAVMEKQPEA